MDKSSSVVEEIRVVYKPTKIGNKPIVTSMDAYEILRYYFDPNTIALQESFVVIFLNNQNFVKGIHRLFVGGIACTIVDIRLIFSIALKSASTSIVISHNHPSGVLKPSQQDLALTKRIREGCQIFEIKLVDHLILSPYGNFYSLADEGDLYSMTGSNN